MTTNTLNETSAPGGEPQFASAWDDNEVSPDSVDEARLVHQALERFHDAPAGSGSYAEIHLVEEEPIVVVSPRDLRPYGATVGGHHSLIDEMRSYGEGLHYPELIDFADKHNWWPERKSNCCWFSRSLFDRYSS